jgi:hypothetical protein
VSTASADLDVAASQEREGSRDRRILFLIQRATAAVLGILAIGAPLLAIAIAVKLAALAILAGLCISRQPLSGVYR